VKNIETKNTYNNRKNIWNKLLKQKYLQLMAMPVIIWLVIFRYLPIFGLQIAFKDYKFVDGIIKSNFVGFKHFYALFSDSSFIPVIINTLGISIIKVIFMFVLPIVLALILNEAKNKVFKKTIQTISYFPHFLSWSVVSVMAVTWLSPTNGFINDFLVAAGILQKPYFFLGKPEAFWWLSLGLEIWKGIGYASIIYLAAISGVDQEIYESATIDGAGRLRKIISITVPCIIPTVMVMFILNIGHMLHGGLYANNFQVSYLLGNPLNISRAEILDTYILKIGVNLGRYSFATAVGLCSSIISMILMLFANKISNKISGQSFL